MAYSIIVGDYTLSKWFAFYDLSQTVALRLDKSRTLETSYSPTTDWEKIFALGDKINQNLNLTEKDVLNEVESFRAKRKNQK